VFARLPGFELDMSRPPVRSTVLTINGFKELHIRWDPAQTQSRAAAGQEKAGSA
jgi:hypothetical protein